MKNIRLLAISNFWAFLIQLACTYFTQRNIINDTSISDISHRFPSLFSPADITFSIWGLIYLLLLILTIYHIIMAFKHSPSHPANDNTHRMGGMFIICNLTTAAWLYCWTHAWLRLSLILIAIQLILLLSLNLRLRIYDRDASVASKICTQLPLSIWFGWITVATIANVDIYLLSTGWQSLSIGLSQERWTAVLIGAAAFIGFCFILGRRNIFYGLVIIWALCGIILRHTATGASVYPELTMTAEVGVIILGIACLLQLARNISFRRHHLRRHYPLFPESPQPLK
jgi:hypothetical protein